MVKEATRETLRILAERAITLMRNTWGGGFTQLGIQEVYRILTEALPPVGSETTFQPGPGAEPIRIDPVSGLDPIEGIPIPSFDPEDPDLFRPPEFEEPDPQTPGPKKKTRTWWVRTTLIGRVESKVGEGSSLLGTANQQDYECTLYPFGIPGGANFVSQVSAAGVVTPVEGGVESPTNLESEAEKTLTETVRQLQIAEGSVIPSGSWVFVNRLTKWLMVIYGGQSGQDPDGGVEVSMLEKHHYMQAPVWICPEE